MYYTSYTYNYYIFYLISIISISIALFYQHRHYISKFVTSSNVYCSITGLYESYSKVCTRLYYVCCLINQANCSPSLHLPQLSNVDPLGIFSQEDEQYLCVLLWLHNVWHYIFSIKTRNDRQVHIHVHINSMYKLII